MAYGTGLAGINGAMSWPTFLLTFGVIMGIYVLVWVFGKRR